MSRHVVVVGGGIVGLCSARELRRRGFDVTVVERDGRDRATTSYGNAGMIVPSHFVPLAAPGVVLQGLRWMLDPVSPFYVKPRASLEMLRWGWRFWRVGTPAHVKRAGPVLLALNLASRRLYDELVPELGTDVGYARRGLYMLCATEAGLEAEARVAEAGRELGVDARVLDAAEVREREPGAELAVAGAVHFPDDAHLDPGALMRALQAGLERDGVRFRFGREVEALELGSDRVTGVRVRGPDGAETLGADDVVLAAGAWSARLARPAGLRLMLEPGKGYSLTLERPSQRLTTPALLAEAHAAVTPMGAKLRIGGTMELSGFDEGENPRRVEGIKRAALRYFPGLTREELDAVQPWQGFRPCTPDGLPYLGRSRRFPNLTVATGHLMMGLSLGPVTGRIVSELVAGETPSVDVAALDPARHTRGAVRRVA